MNNFHKYILYLLLFLSFNSNAELKWEQKANFRGSGRHRGTGFSIKDKGYIGLGHINSVVNIPFADIWEYDPATDTWSQKADYPTGGNYGAACFTIDDKAYVGNGVYSNGEFYSFDPINNEWEQIASCPNTASEATGFSINGKGYFAAENELYEYNPNNDSWSIKASPPSSLGLWISSFTIGGNGYVLSGGNLYEYKQSVDNWSTRSPIPNGVTGGAAAFSINNRGYIIAGYTDFLSGITSEVWEFNPGSNEWTSVIELPGSSRRFTVGFSIDNFGYVGTGTNGVNFNDFYQLGLIEKYNALEDLESIKIKLFPNPTHDFLNINSSNNIGEMIIDIIDLKGSLITNYVFSNNAVINVSNLKKGIYSYSISQNDKVIKSGKFLKE